MTCIVGLASEGKVIIGGDSAGVSGYSLQVRADEKVFENGDFLFGFTTSFRMGQILRYSFEPPKRYAEEDVMAYMATDFIEGVRKALSKGGFASKKDDVERGGTFLVGHAGRLFRIEGDFQVGETINGYDACGCGEDIARGALHVTRGIMNDSTLRVRYALEAAADHSAAVCGPFKIMEGKK